MNCWQRRVLIFFSFFFFTAAGVSADTQLACSAPGGLCEDKYLVTCQSSSGGIYERCATKCVCSSTSGGTSSSTKVVGACGTRAGVLPRIYKEADFLAKSICAPGDYHAYGDGALFPKPGATHSWRCTGTSNTAYCSVCRNLYKTKSELSCPAGASTSTSSCPNYPNNCSVSTVNFSNNCKNYTFTCYLPTCSATNGVCNSGDYTTAAAAIGSGSCRYNYTTYATTNASCGGSNITCYHRSGGYSNPANGSCTSGTYTTAAAAIGTGTCKYSYSAYATTNATCGGANITCYRRGSTYTNPTNGTCTAGTYTTATAAVGTGTCRYNYTPYATANATCGGSNITCYQRTSGYSNQVAGVCGTAHNQVFAHTATGYGSLTQCAAGIASSATFPALGATASWTCTGSCGGATSTCSACRNQYELEQNCNIYSDSQGKSLLYSNNPCLNPNACWTKLVNYSASCSNYLQTCYKAKTCAETNPVSNSNSYLPLNQITSTDPPYKLLPGKPDGDNTACYRRALCTELTDDFTASTTTQGVYTTATACAASNLLSVPTPYQDGLTGSACVACLKVSRPFFAVVSGNIYAQGRINVGQTQLDQVNVLRGDTCGYVTDSSSVNNIGMAIAGASVDYISSESTAGASASFTSGQVTVVPENYAYFVSTLGFDPQTFSNANLQTCRNLDQFNPNNFTAVTDSLACLYDGDTALSNLLSSLEVANLAVPARQKLVLFINGDLQLDRTTSLGDQSSLLFIVAGNITVDPELGEFIDPATTNCTATASASAALACTDQSPSLHGVFIADGNISFPSGASALDPQSLFWNPSVKRACDKRLLVKGSFLAWGSAATVTAPTAAVTIGRTFTGCLPGFSNSTAPSYTNYLTDYNSCIPVITFIYDPQLVQALPSWLKKTYRAKFEVN